MRKSTKDETHELIAVTGERACGSANFGESEGLGVSEDKLSRIANLPYLSNNLRTSVGLISWI